MQILGANTWRVGGSRKIRIVTHQARILRHVATSFASFCKQRKLQLSEQSVTNVDGDD